MPNAFEDKELASRAGKLSGPSKKSKQWDELGKAIVGHHAERFNTMLNGMEDEEFAKQFINVLNYFKPKLSSAQIKADADVNINIKEPSWNDGDGH